MVIHKVLFYIGQLAMPASNYFTTCSIDHCVPNIMPDLQLVGKVVAGSVRLNSSVSARN